MALGATVRPWKDVVGWKPWADATKSAPYNAVERITMLTLNSEADPQLSLCWETAYIKFLQVVAESTQNLSTWKHSNKGVVATFHER
jgi:hypothetical protein